MADQVLIFIIVVLLFIFMLSVIALVTGYRYYNDLQGRTYTRGANQSGPGDVKMKCGNGKEICVYKATQICTNPDGNNFENEHNDPISSGYDNPDSYGDFDPCTTVDLLKEISEKCNGQKECIYNFKGNTPFPFDGECKGDNATVQLISTYTCIPKGSECISKPPSNYTCGE